MSKSDSDFTLIKGIVKRETEKAVLLDNGDWYPKSQIKEMRPEGILVAKWVAEKKSTKAKNPSETSDSVPNSNTNTGSEFNEDNLVECRIKLETARATLVVVKNTGREVWFPKTTIKKAFDGDVFVGIVPQTWMYKKKVESGEIKPTSNPEPEPDTDQTEQDEDMGEDTPFLP